MSNLPQATIDRINAEAKKAAMITEYREYDSGPSNSARMQQTSRIDPIQKEFYTKGATEWAGKAEEHLIPALEAITGKTMPVPNKADMIEIALNALAKYMEVGNG